MTANDRTLRRLLQMFQAEEQMRPRGFYAGMYDFVLREGTWFDPPTGPLEYQRGAPRMCFGNAIVLAATRGLRYIEGFALSPLGLPIHHAWNLDPAGQVVDTTWGLWAGGRCLIPMGLAYVGVEFAVERADEATWNGDASVLDDWNRGWPLMQHPWEGERTDWQESDRIKALRLLARGYVSAGAALMVEATR